MKTPPIYDVAFSFLDVDKSLALALESKLQPNLNVFVYATRQQILAGSEGLESFRNVFLSQTRLVAVLYRKGWGESKFTRIEETAIRDRGFDEHWENFLLFVTLNDNDPVPAWLPKHHIRLSYPTYGPDQLVGAIKLRAQAVGVVPRTENSVQKALRLHAEAEIRQEREAALSAQQTGLGPAQSEASIVFDVLEERLSKLSSAVPSLQLEWSRDQIRDFRIRSKHTSISIVPHWDYPADKSRLQVFEFLGHVTFPNESGLYFPGPKRVRDSDYIVDFDRAYGGWCWKTEWRRNLMTSTDVAEQIAERVVELQAKADRGELKRDLDDFWPGP